MPGNLLARSAVTALIAVSGAVPAAAAAPGPSPAPAPSRAQQVFAAMTDAQRVGQLLMVGSPSTAAGPATLAAIRRDHVGAVILDGNSTLGIAAQRAVTARLQAAAPAHTKLLIATDQEGGLVRRMRGPGFTQFASALVQGSWAPLLLQRRATTWAHQLRAAGIGVDLAPVLDTVPPGDVNNPPIGDLDREFGHVPWVVRNHGLAVLRGMAAGGVMATVKHFPGLGRVTANTDTSRGVVDTVTTAGDAYLRPFAAAIRAGAPLVMVSTAIYRRIDPTAPAAFSARIVTGLLRGSLHFRGVVISDDLGVARQVSGYQVGGRAWRFIAAGGDLVLTVDRGQAATMTRALLDRMHSNGVFRAKVYAAVLRVLALKQADGLLG